jgi:beta-phosphoglucomutase-like phosphatase (HAD superfamily)
MPIDQLKAMIWDMDGTLIDSGAVAPDAFIATVQAISGRTHTSEQVIDLYPGGTLERKLAAARRADPERHPWRRDRSIWLRRTPERTPGHER